MWATESEFLLHSERLLPDMCNSLPELFGHWVHWLFSGLFNAEQQWPLGLSLHLLYRHREVKYCFCIPALFLAVEKNHRNNKKRCSLLHHLLDERGLHYTLPWIIQLLSYVCGVSFSGAPACTFFNPVLKALNTCAYSVTSALWYTNNR